MDTKVQTKEECLEDLLYSIKEYAKIGDWEWVESMGEEIVNLAKIDTPQVIVEECPMSGSNIWIKPIGGENA